MNSLDGTDEPLLRFARPDKVLDQQDVLTTATLQKSAYWYPFAKTHEQIPA